MPRHAFHRSLIAPLAIAIAVACGKDSTSPKSTTSAAAGTYLVERYYGLDIPAVLFLDTTSADTVFYSEGKLVLANPNVFVLTQLAEEDSAGTTRQFADTSTGTWTATSTKLHVRFSSGSPDSADIANGRLYFVYGADTVQLKKQ